MSNVSNSNPRGKCGAKEPLRAARANILHAFLKQEISIYLNDEAYGLLICQFSFSRREIQTAIDDLVNAGLAKIECTKWGIELQPIGEEVS